MNTNTKWIIYARKSTESSERQVQSIPDQLKIFNDVALRNNLNLVETITDEKSARKPGLRKGFALLIKKIEKGEIQGILCWKLNRLARNLEEGGKIIQLLQTGQIACIKTIDRDYTSSDNVIVIAVEMGMANQEIRDLALGVKRGMKSKAESGWYPGLAPVGYRNSKSGQRGLEKILVDKTRFPIIRKMWDLMLTGNYSPSAIHRIAQNEWNFTTLKRKKAGGRSLSLSNIYQLFQNIFYTGLFRFGGKTYTGKHTPMITMKEFELVQTLLGNKVSASPIRHTFPFTGIMRCANCGGAITATIKNKFLRIERNYKTYTYYHCSHNSGDRSCRQQPVSAKELENQIIDHLNEYSISDEFYQFGLRLLLNNENQLRATHQAILQQQKFQLKELQNKQSNAFTYLINGTISESEYTSLKNDIEFQSKAITIKISQTEDFVSGFTKQMENALHFSRYSIHAIQNGDDSLRRDILNHFGSNQRIKDKRLLINIHRWVLAIKKDEDNYIRQKESFEPTKRFKTQGLGEKNSKFLTWCAALEHARTAIMEYAANNYPNIPDLSQWKDSSDL